MLIKNKIEPFCGEAERTTVQTMSTKCKLIRDQDCLCSQWQVSQNSDLHLRAPGRSLCPAVPIKLRSVDSNLHRQTCGLCMTQNLNMVVVSDPRPIQWLSVDLPLARINRTRTVIIWRRLHNWYNLSKAFMRWVAKCVRKTMQNPQCANWWSCGGLSYLSCNTQFFQNVYECSPMDGICFTNVVQWDGWCKELKQHTEPQPSCLFAWQM